MPPASSTPFSRATAAAASGRSCSVLRGRGSMKLGSVHACVRRSWRSKEMLAKVRVARARSGDRAWHRRLAGQRSPRPRRAARQQEHAPREYRQMIADAGLTISALVVPRQSAASRHARRAKADDDVFRKTVRLAEQLEVPVVVTFSGCPGDSDDAKHPNWVTTPWPPEFLDVLDWQWEKKAIPYWTEPRGSPRDHGVKVALEAHPGFLVYNVDSALQLRARGGAEPRRQLRSEPFLLAGRRRAGRDPRARRRDLPRARQGRRISIGRTSRSTASSTPRRYRRMAERSWLFRSVGWGHDELEWKRIVSALRLAGLRLRDEHRARGRAGVGRRRAARGGRSAVARDPDRSRRWRRGGRK